MSKQIESSPIIYDDMSDVGKLNALLDQLTEKPFTNPFIVVNAVRGALNLYGITLPVLEIESQPTGPDMLASLTQLHMGKQPIHPPVECEYLFKIEDVDGRDGSTDKDWDDHLYLYLVIDRREDTGLYESYAQVVDNEEVDELLNMDVPEKMEEFPEFFYGDESGETQYDRQVRHSGVTDKPGIGQ